MVGQAVVQATFLNRVNSRKRKPGAPLDAANKRAARGGASEAESHAFMKDVVARNRVLEAEILHMRLEQPRELEAVKAEAHRLGHNQGVRDTIGQFSARISTPVQGFTLKHGAGLTWAQYKTVRNFLSYDFGPIGECGRHQWQRARMPQTGVPYPALPLPQGWELGK